MLLQATFSGSTWAIGRSEQVAIAKTLAEATAEYKNGKEELWPFAQSMDVGTVAVGCGGCGCACFAPRYSKSQVGPLFFEGTFAKWKPMLAPRQAMSSIQDTNEQNVKDSNRMKTVERCRKSFQARSHTFPH